MDRPEPQPVQPVYSYAASGTTPNDYEGLKRQRWEEQAANNTDYSVLDDFLAKRRGGHHATGTAVSTGAAAVHVGPDE